MAVNDIYRLSALWQTSGNDTAQNTWAFRQEDALPLDTPGQDLTDSFIANALASYRALVSASFSLVSLHVRGVTDPTYGFDRTTTGNPGDLSGEAFPFQVSAIISWRTSLIGRRNRGRTYLPPTTEAQASSGVLVAGYVTNISAFADDLLQMSTTTTTESGWTLGIYSEAGSVFNPVTGYIVRSIMGTQRKRRPS